MFHNSVRGVSKSSLTYVCWSCLLRSDLYAKNRHLSTPVAFSASAPRPTEDALLLAGNAPLKDEPDKEQIPCLDTGTDTSTNIGNEGPSRTAKYDGGSRGERDGAPRAHSSPAVGQSLRVFNPYKNGDVREMFPHMTKRERKLYSQSQCLKENLDRNVLEALSKETQNSRSSRNVAVKYESNSKDVATPEEHSANRQSSKSKPNEDINNDARTLENVLRQLTTTIELKKGPTKSTPRRHGPQTSVQKANSEKHRTSKSNNGVTSAGDSSGEASMSIEEAVLQSSSIAKIPRPTRSADFGSSVMDTSDERPRDTNLQTQTEGTNIKGEIASDRTKEDQVDNPPQDAVSSSAATEVGKSSATPRKVRTRGAERKTTESAGAAAIAKEKKGVTALSTARRRKSATLRRIATLRLRRVKTEAVEIPTQQSRSKTTRIIKHLAQSTIITSIGSRFKEGLLKAPRKTGQATAAEDMLRKEVDSQTIAARDIEIAPLDTEQPSVPTLSHGLERVLFNPGVYHLQDPRSRVFNFDPYLQKIMPVSEFDFDSLKEYITSSRDEVLRDLALEEGRKYIGSSSSMTSALAHFHFLLSQWREINVEMLSRGFPTPLRSFTKIQRSPSAIFLRWKNGVYAIDADKEFDSANVLMSLGKSMEKLLTLPMSDFERYRRSNEEKISDKERTTPEAYHYSTSGDFLMRSQLDAHDERLPGTGMFDLKTRAVVSIRMDTKNYEKGMGYQIKDRFGEWESYEREYFDMIRSAFLKYSLQVRMGRMDGIFVAFHNIERIFGFQYISLPEMDQSLHGDSTTKIGDEEFRLSIHLFNKLLDRATEKFPETSLRLHFETRDTQCPFMYVFAEPVTEEQIQTIQTGRKQEIEAFERTVLGQQPKDAQILSEAQDSPEVSIDNPEKLEKDETLTVSINQLSAEAELETQPDITDSVLVAHTSEIEYSGGEAPLFANPKSSNDAIIQTGAEQDRNDAGEGTMAGSDSNPVTEVTTTESEGADVMEASGGNRGSEVTESGSETASNLSSREEDSEAPADIMFLNDLGQRDAQASEESPPLLGMTLSIQNKVDGKLVKRPDKLRANQQWTVEYQISEIKESRRRSLYEMCKKRRQAQLAEVEEDTAANYYLRKLQELSSKGKVWRDEQERAQGKEQVVLSRS